MRKLAIVILNWNGKDMMLKYLPSVIANSVGDVIVADNASTDGSVEMLAEHFHEVPTIVLDKNYGFAGGYNKALAQLNDYEYYLLLNSDVEILQKEWDKPLLEYMDAHPQCAACQPKLMSLRALQDMSAHKGDDDDKGEERAKGKSQGIPFEYAGAAGGFIDRYGYPFCRGRILSTVEDDNGQYDTIAPLLWATGAAILVRASDWKASGGLDSRFFAHMEEIDLCWRLRLMGKSIVCIPDSTAYHLGGATLNQGNPHKTFLNFRNNLLMLYKNLPDGELDSVMRIRRMLDYVAAMQFLLKGDKANFDAVIKARKEFGRIKEDFTPDRKKIQSTAATHSITERMPISILFQYYIKGIRTFSEIDKRRGFKEELKRS